ncbi:hypothetical protein AB0N17_37405 [Streptomyces sp. NPDC051133]|uniref:hypothetical protein n=1 Tax=Streptomyces sp. NPDC051133 TaxID=3155521 RepID=UPI00343659B8
MTASDRGTFQQRISPYPISTPRSTWERFNVAKTDSGWPLLIANLLLGAAAAGLCTYLSASRGRSFLLFAVALAGHAVRTLYVMVCLARDESDRRTTGNAAEARRSTGRHR